jgi:hypothetical protein
VPQTLIAEDEDGDLVQGDSLTESATTSAGESRPSHNRRNGRSSNTVQGKSSKLEIATPALFDFPGLGVTRPTIS